MEIYKINFFLIFFLTYLYFLWACQMQKDRSTDRQTDRRSLSPTLKNWRTDMITNTPFNVDF